MQPAELLAQADCSRIMKLILNTESVKPPLTGIGNYTLNLLRAFCCMEQIQQLNCFDGRSFLTPEAVLGDLTYESLGITPQSHSRVRSTIRALPFAYSGRSLLRGINFFKGSQARKDFIYHEPNFILKPHSGPSVVTIHDLSFLRYPEFHPRERVKWLTKRLPNTLRRADLVITDSNVVRNEILANFPIEPGRVRTIYLGVTPDFHPRDAQSTSPFLDRCGLRHGQYVAFVATLEPRKGISLLLNAWEQLPRSVRSHYPLVIAGAPGWKNEAILQRIQKMAILGDLKYLHYVAPHDLPHLYSGATAFVYPSVYEGFGLPVLEAMRSGTPVICARETAMAEFTAGESLLFDAGCEADLANKLLRLLEDENQRKDFIIRGLKRSQNFSWERCAAETAEAYSAATYK